MRLECLDSGQTAPIRAFIKAAKLPDVVKTLLYRPRAFGLHFTRVMHPAMRGPSPWTVGERELFAAYTSRLNQCPF